MWQAQHLLKFKCHFSLQAQYLVKFKSHFKGQAQYLLGEAQVSLCRGRRSTW